MKNVHADKFATLCTIWKNANNTNGGILPLTLLKIKLHHECFSRFLSHTNGTKLRKESQL